MKKNNDWGLIQTAEILWSKYGEFVLIFFISEKLKGHVGLQVS